MSNTAEGIILIFTLLLIGVLALLLLIIPLIGALKLKKDIDKLVWVLIIIFLYPIGSIVYLLIRPHKRES